MVMDCCLCREPLLEGLSVSTKRLEHVLKAADFPFEADVNA